MKRTSHFQFCLTMSFKTQSSFFFFFFFFFVRLVLNLNQDSFVSFTIKGRELPRFFLYLFSYFFLLSPLLANNKSLYSLQLKWIWNFKQIYSPLKLVTNKQLSKCFFRYSWYSWPKRRIVSFIRKFSTNLFPFLSFFFFFFFYIC